MEGDRLWSENGEECWMGGFLKFLPTFILYVFGEDPNYTSSWGFMADTQDSIEGLRSLVYIFGLDLIEVLFDAIKIAKQSR